MIGAVSKSIPVGTIELSDEFFPAHLSVALIDAVFRSHLRDDEQPAPSAERYCRYFEIAMTRPNRWSRPPSDAQETLGDLTGRYFELGVNGMTNEVFQTRCRFPGTETTRTEYVLRVANELRRIGIEVLQDVSVRRTPGDRRRALFLARSRPAHDPHALDVFRRRRLRMRRRPRATIRVERHRPQFGLRIPGGESRPAFRLRDDPLAQVPGPPDLEAQRFHRTMRGQAQPATIGFTRFPVVIRGTTSDMARGGICGSRKRQTHAGELPILGLLRPWPERLRAANDGGMRFPDGQ